MPSFPAPALPKPHISAITCGPTKSPTNAAQLCSALLSSALYQGTMRALNSGLHNAPTSMQHLHCRCQM